MGLQDKPRCYLCREEIVDEEPVYAAPCGHRWCPSAVWHGLHLMEWRERKAAQRAAKGQR